MKLANLGISDNSHVVVYFDTDQSFSMATRVLFTLQYVGLSDHTSFLDGGMADWIKAGNPVSAAIPTVIPAEAERASHREYRGRCGSGSHDRTTSQLQTCRRTSSRLLHRHRSDLQEERTHPRAGVNIPFHRCRRRLRQSRSKRITPGLSGRRHKTRRHRCRLMPYRATSYRRHTRRAPARQSSHAL